MGWVCLALSISPAVGQVFLVIDTTRLALNPDREGNPMQWFPFRLTSVTEYTLSASTRWLVNSATRDEPGHVLLQHAFRFTWTIVKEGKVACTHSFSHRLGFLYLFDSVTRIQADENLFRTHLDLYITGIAGIAFDSEISTRLFTGYDYLKDDSGRMERRLNSSFLTPLIWNLSAGISFKIPGTGSGMIGLSGVKLTCLRDTSVFTEQQAVIYQGVRKGHDHLLEYGLSCRFQADRSFWKIVRWNCDMLIFKGYNKPADLNFRNLFEIRPVSFLVISLQTRVWYEEDISRRICTENLLSVGFSLKK